MNGHPLAKDIFSHPAQVVLLGCFGVSLAMAARRGEGLSFSFESYAIGFLLIVFHQSALQALFSLGVDLNSFLGQLGEQESLKTLVAKTLVASVEKFSKEGMKAAPGIIGGIGFQLLHESVWGIVTTITDLVFLLAAYILEVSRDVLWQILFLLFPLGAGVFPLFPKITGNLCVLAVELVLWLPLLKIVNAATGLLAKNYLHVSLDPGFYILACEIVAVLMTLSIPTFAHRLVIGSLAGSVMHSWAKTLATVGVIGGRGGSLGGLSVRAARNASDYAARGASAYAALKAARELRKSGGVKWT